MKTKNFSQSAFSNFAQYVINVVRIQASPGHLFCMVPRKGKPVTLLKILLLLRRTVNNTIAFNLGCWMNTRKRLVIYELFSCSRVIYSFHAFANSPFFLHVFSVRVHRFYQNTRPSRSLNMRS